MYARVGWGGALEMISCGPALVLRVVWLEPSLPTSAGRASVSF